MKRNLEPLSLDLDLGHERIGENAWVLTPRGAIDSTTSDDFKNRLQKFFDGAGTPAHFLLDMAGVKYLSSMGLGTLITFLKQSKEKNGSFSLYDMQRPVQRVLEISHLDFLMLRPEQLEPDHPFAAYIQSQESVREPQRKAAEAAKQKS